jgi:hypothetical protein
MILDLDLEDEDVNLEPCILLLLLLGSLSAVYSIVVDRMGPEL